MAEFSDEVVVLDSGSTDGTLEALKVMAEADPKIKVYEHKIDLSSDNFAHEGDGLQKGRARKFCTGEVLFQFDCDEVIIQNDAVKVRDLCQQLYESYYIAGAKNEYVFIYPMIEFWGKDKFRADIVWYKPRISFNTPYVTHDIPSSYRRFAENGRIYSVGSDGCDYVNSEDFTSIVPFCPFELNRLHFLESARAQNIEIYQNALLKLANDFGAIYHYSWYDIPRKIRTYRDYWANHWNSLFNGNMEDTAQNNMFFNKPWSEVTEEEIDRLGSRLEKELGGWIFHRKVDFSRPTKWIDVDFFRKAGICA